MLAPLQIVDSFLLNYNLGDALLVGFGLGLVATLPLKSWKTTTLHILLFGLLFLVTPAQMLAVDSGGSHFLGSALQYKLLGLGLLAVGPVLYTTGNQ
ncbi:hypothetical protein BRD09_05155 [Halobacteriales archaeon SW_10_68_16]|jgi:hypothetical protein|nr:MAG: hypothetical protein BRD09_05155 [Halobacteriales archaeon SW_10_68_16]